MLCCSQPDISVVMVSWTAALLTSASWAAAAGIAGGLAFRGRDGSLARHHCSADTDAGSAEHAGCWSQNAGMLDHVRGCALDRQYHAESRRVARQVDAWLCWTGASRGCSRKLKAAPEKGFADRRAAWKACRRPRSSVVTAMLPPASTSTCCSARPALSLYTWQIPGLPLKMPRATCRLKRCLDSTAAVGRVVYSARY